MDVNKNNEKYISNEIEIAIKKKMPLPILDEEWQRNIWIKTSSIFKISVPLGDGGCKEDDWLPTPHGLTLSEAIFFRIPSLVESLSGRNVLELGSGVGNHSILIHRCQPKSLTMTEITDSRLLTTKQSMVFNKCTSNTLYVTADWLSVPDCNSDDRLYDTVITNPPFCMSGKYNRRYYFDELILNSHKILRPGGSLIFIQSSMADLPKTLSRLEENGFKSEIIYQKRYPWREYYFNDPTFLTLVDKIEGAYETTYDGRRIETLSIIKATLLNYKPYFSH